jgi:ribonuclease P protein subunit RPR2
MRGVSMARGKRPDWMIEIAQERMNILFSRAEMEYDEHPERSHRYVELARKISKKYNTKIPQAWGRRYCKHCYKFLVPGHNCTVRLINNEINIFCGECGRIMKIPYIREKKLKRRAKIDSYTFKKRDYE